MQQQQKRSSGPLLSQGRREGRRNDEMCNPFNKNRATLSVFERFSSAIVAENKRGFVALIPDIKCFSPKEGDLLRGRNPVEMAQFLVRCGAPVLSVVTENARFGGSTELLRAIAQAVEVPVLRKDFIQNEEQLVETAELGAAAVLLICAIVDEKTLQSLYEKTLKLGMEPLVEVHTVQEMEVAKALGARLIGINNRNILTFELDEGGPERTAALVSGKPTGALLVSESGILSPEHARLAAASGAHALLVGTALWLAPDMEATYQSLWVAVEREKTRPIVKICGLMREEDVRLCARHGADILGFVVEYPRPVPWNLSVAQAKALMAAVPRTQKTCVVTSGTPAHVLHMAAETKPDIIQLHGNETLEEVAYLVGALGKQGIKLIKALFPNTPELEKTAVDFCAAGVYAVLFDARTPDNAQHSGTANVSVYKKLQRALSCPLMLAGGITPQNITEILRQTQANMLDLMSGVEISPGVKDEAKVKALFEALV